MSPPLAIIRQTVFNYYNMNAIDFYREDRPLFGKLELEGNVKVEDILLSEVVKKIVSCIGMWSIISCSEGQ